VDSSNYKQGTVIAGKNVVSPEIINKENIDAVIIPTVTQITISSIKQSLSQKYQSVKHIMTISELCMYSTREFDPYGS
jgi:hypothetical protein